MGSIPSIFKPSCFSDPEQFLPPRDPDGVAAFCRPATRATQRPCQPWEAGRAERQGVAVEGRVVVDAGADELGVGVVHENAGGEGVEDALGDDGVLRVVAVGVAEADSQGDAQRGGERVEGAEEDLGPAAQVCVGEEGPERHALESLPRLGCQVARRAPGHGPGDRPPERARCDCEAAPGGSRWR